MSHFTKKTKTIITAILVFALVIGIPTYTTATKKIKCRTIKLASTTVTVGLGDIIYLDEITTPANANGKRKWSSSNSKVAMVNGYGTVTAKAVGEAIVTVKLDDKKATCKVIVKKYLSAEEVKTLVQSNSISEETIKKLIAENTFSKEEISKMIDEKVKTNTSAIAGLSKEDVNALIEEKVKTNTSTAVGLTKEEVNVLIDEKLTNSNTPTMTKDEITALIDSKMSQSTIGTSDDWEDGTEVLPYYRFKLPLVTTSYSGLTDMANITSVEIKKYHYDDFKGRNYCKYKYHCIIRGKRLLSELQDHYCSGSLLGTNFSVSLSEKDGVIKGTKDSDTWSDNLTYEEDEEKNFVIEFNTYSCIDYNEWIPGKDFVNYEVE